MSSTPTAATIPRPPPPAATETPVDTLAIANDPARSEADWFRLVYQGDKVPQLTLRAVLMGGVLGMLMSAANLYTTLKIGWSFGVAITSCVMSYVIWNLFRLVSGGRLSPMSILENNCMQSTASAAGYSTGSTVATAFGALLLLEGYHQPVWVVATFTLFTGALGVFLAVPMKRQMINQEKLAFPSGVAAAATLKSLYSHGAEALRKAYVLIGGLAAGLIVGVFNTDEGTLGILDRLFRKTRVHLPDLIPANGYFTVNNRQLINFGFAPSVLLLGAGMIVGLRVSLSMLAGGLLLYLWVGPALIAMDVAHAGEAAYKISIPLIGGGTIYHLPRWALWGGHGDHGVFEPDGVRPAVADHCAFVRHPQARAAGHGGHGIRPAHGRGRSPPRVARGGSDSRSRSDCWPCSMSPFTSASGWALSPSACPSSSAWWRAGPRARPTPRRSAPWARSCSCSSPCCRRRPPRACTSRWNTTSWRPAPAPTPPPPAPICSRT